LSYRAGRPALGARGTLRRRHMRTKPCQQEDGARYDDKALVNQSVRCTDPDFRAMATTDDLPLWYTVI
jgi:hypothetical protein